MTVHLATKKSNPSGTTFKLKFVRFFDKLNPIFTGNQNICIATVVVPLASKKSNPTSTKFELKFIFFPFRFFIYHYTETNTTFPFHTLIPVPPECNI